jgi:hypothetical protein
MKKLGKIANYLFPDDNGGGPLLLPAFVAAASSSGVVAVWLWMAHSPPALSPLDAARRDCLERCEQVCGGSAYWQR